MVPTTNAHARRRSRTTTRPPPTQSPRERIISTADDLFYKFGIRSVGIDRIIAESDVAKMTFYKYFPSKSKLVAAYLERRRSEWQEAITKAISLDCPVVDRILAIFDTLDNICRMSTFQGCPFIKAMAEFGRDHKDPEIQAQISLHFNDTSAMIGSLVSKLGLSEELTQAIVSLIFGCIVVSNSTGRTDVAQINKRAARSLLTEHN